MLEAWEYEQANAVERVKLGKTKEAASEGHPITKEGRREGFLGYLRRIGSARRCRLSLHSG